MLSRRLDQLNEKNGSVVSKVVLGNDATADDRSLFAAAAGDGRFPIALTGFCLVTRIARGTCRIYFSSWPCG
jgi:hypothetical protein